MSSLTASIAIPFHKYSEDVEKAVRSALNQSRPAREIIIINDGAPKKFAERLRDISPDTIQLVDDGQSLGLAKRLNQTIQIAKGSVYFRMDSDDVMHPHRVRTQLEVMEKSPEIDLVGSATYIIGENGSILGVRRPGHGRVVNASPFKGSVLIHPTVAMRTKWGRENPYREDLRRTEDKELWVRSIPHSHVHVLNEPLHFYRQDTNLGRYVINQTAKEERYIARLHGGGAERSVELATFTATNVVKQSAKLAIEGIGLGERLLRRYAPITDDERGRALSMLAIALADERRG